MAVFMNENSITPLQEKYNILKLELCWFVMGQVDTDRRGLKTHDNITLLNIPPYTLEMNPIEQIRKQLRAMGFKNVFKTLNHVVDRLCKTIRCLSRDVVNT